MWMVRAEVGGRLFEEFKTRSLVAIGWVDLGDLGRLKSREDFQREVGRALPTMRPGQVAASAGQTFRFVREIKIGDRILTYNPPERIYLVGTIIGDHEYDPAGLPEDPNIRRVEWQGNVARDQLSVATRNSLGSISTLFLVSAEAAIEIEAVLKGALAPAATQAEQQESVDVDDLLRNMQNRALEFVKDKVSELDWQEMQEVVAGLLRAMGYKTRISPSGPDRGKDIVASPDGFGFQSPRIVVEVKHRTSSSMGAHEIRSFLGGRHADDKGLYVSTGGFSKDARYEAERARIPLTLMDLDDLVRAILEHYEEMDADTQRLIPLRKVYWPG